VPVRVLLCGLGDIGVAIARQVTGRDGFRIVGAVDADPGKIGRDIGDVAGAGHPLRVKVSADLRKTIRGTKPDIVVLCTSASMKALWPALETALTLRVPVVSTCEELVYPTGGNIRIARRIHELARKKKVAVLGTGINPGFAMDALPIALTSACERVDTIRVDRVHDAGLRGVAFQQRIGAGLTREQFQRNVDAGLVRHVGFAESVSMIAAAMGWPLDRITDDIQPKIAVQTVASEYIAVDPGYVCGIIQDARGYSRGTPVIHLHMEAYLGAHESSDAVTIEGAPRIACRVQGGIHGDEAVASIVLNSIPRVVAASPGLHTMRDMPLPAYCGGSGVRR
jgi:4-hydroxy-tetrahydrodipicolinate reductase